MDNQALQRIKDTIAQSQNMVVAVSANPTVDQMAGALAFSLSLNEQGKKVNVLSPTEPIVELSSLVGIDKVRTENSGTGGDLVVSFPYREGEIEKVSYTIDNGYLNIVVKAGEQGLTFSEQDVIFKRGGGKPDVIITVGVSRLNELSELLSDEALKDTPIINIDNNNSNEGFGDTVLVSDKFSSLSEQIADLLLNLGMDIDIDAAQNLLSGISYATDNFQSPATSYLAFEIAAILMKRGAVRPASTVPVARPQAHNRRDEQQRGQGQGQPVRMQQQQQPRGGNSQNQQTQNQQRQEQIRQALRQGQQNRQSDQQNRQSDQQKPPSDWLTPKVYKGSTSV